MLETYADFGKHAVIANLSGAAYRTGFTGWKRHRVLAEHQLLFIDSGSGVIEIQGSRHRLCQGDLVYLSPGTRYGGLAQAQGGHIDFLNVQFVYAVMDCAPLKWRFETQGNYSVLEQARPAGELVFTDAPLPFPAVHRIGNVPLVRALFFEIFQDYCQTSAASKAPDIFLLSRLINLVALDCFGLANGSHRYADMARQYLEDHLAQPVSLADMGQVLGISKSYLIRIFKEQLGVTPIRYINQLRMKQAEKLLLETGQSVRDIAGCVGFEDEAYFSRAFKQSLGVSPQKYRLLHRASYTSV